MVMTMKKLAVFVLIISILALCGCGTIPADFDIVATTLPVYDFTSALCTGTDLTVGRLVTESVSCLHDYTLQVWQMRMIEQASVVVISGAGLEDFLEDALSGSQLTIDASSNTHLHSGEHHHEDSHSHSHSHDLDPHIWLSTENAAVMAQNICSNLSEIYPQYRDVFQANLDPLLQKLNDLQFYGQSQLSDLSSRDLITFHDGFAYFAESFDLRILEAIEEESGSEASAAEIIHLVELVKINQLPAVFTEVSGSDACASIISSETGAKIFTLDMAMSGDSYFDAMYHNIDTVKEALK